MPKDSSGKFHLNSQRAHAADRASEGAKKPPASAAKEPMHEGGGESMAHTTLHDHGDGSFHTEGHDGERVEHPHIGHALMHMAGKHGGGGTHMHAHHDGFSHTTHHVSEGGQVEGPHEHESSAEVGNHYASITDGSPAHDWENEPPEEHGY